MSDFKVIETQEQFDAVISERLKREREVVRKEYEGYLSPDEIGEKYKDYLSPEQAEGKYKGYLSPEEAAKKDAEIKRHETNSLKVKIAQETGIPYELAGRLSGDNEESIRKDAETVAKYLKKTRVPPLKSTEEPTGNSKKEALRKTLSELKGE